MVHGISCHGNVLKARVGLLYSDTAWLNLDEFFNSGASHGPLTERVHRCIIPRLPRGLATVYVRSLFFATCNI
jgi:hypothetical protein